MAPQRSPRTPRLVAAVALLAAALGLVWWISGDPGPDQAAVPESPGSEDIAATAELVEPTVERSVAVVEDAAAEPAPAPVAAEPPVEDAPASGTCLRLSATLAGEPLAALRVHLMRTSEPFLPRDLGEYADVTRVVALDAQGQALVCGLEAQPYLVAFEFDSGVVGKRVTLVADETAELDFDLGTGSIHGTVNRAQWTPAEGARVQVTSRGDEVTHVVHTDAAGDYRVEGLPRAPYWFSVTLSADPYDDADHYLQPALEEGEVLRADFGPSDGAVTFAGVLRDRAGDPLRLVGRGAATLHVFGDVARAHLPVDVDAEGRFEVALEPGTYRVTAEHSSYWESVELADALVVPPGGLAQDLVVPGVTVRGRLTGTRAAGRSGVRAHPEGELAPAVFRWSDSPDGESFAIHGLTPGSWRIGAYGQDLDAFVDLQVRASDTVLSLDLPQD